MDTHVPFHCADQNAMDCDYKSPPTPSTPLRSHKEYGIGSIYSILSVPPLLPSTSDKENAVPECPKTPIHRIKGHKMGVHRVYSNVGGHSVDHGHSVQLSLPSLSLPKNGESTAFEVPQAISRKIKDRCNEIQYKILENKIQTYSIKSWLSPPE